MSSTVMSNGPHYRVMPANVVNVRHTNEEFGIDFGLTQIGPYPDHSWVHTTMVVSAQTAKRLMLGLSQMVGQYEAVFGEIVLQPEHRLIRDTESPEGESLVKFPVLANVYGLAASPQRAEPQFVQQFAADEAAPVPNQPPQL